MTSRRPTRLIDRAHQKVVPAEILNEISREELIDIHLDWQPARIAALKTLRSQGTPWPENWHWDWSSKADNLSLLAYRCFAVECEDRPQRLMMISTIGRNGRMAGQAGKPVLYTSKARRGISPLLPIARYFQESVLRSFKLPFKSVRTRDSLGASRSTRYLNRNRSAAVSCTISASISRTPRNFATSR